MPGLPQYQPGEQTRALPTPYADSSVPTSAFGASVIAQPAAAAAKIVDDEIDKANVAQVTGAAAQFRDFISGKLYDPKTGLYSKKGVEGVGASAQVLADIDKQAQQITGALANQDQRDAFKRQALLLAGEAKSKANEYALRQNDQANADAVQARIDAGTRAIGADPSTLGTETPRMLQSLRASAQYRGALPETQKSMEQGVQASAAEVAMNSYLAQSLPGPARAIFAANRDVLGEKAPGIEARIRAHEEQQASITDAMGYLSRNAVPGTTFYDEANARAQYLASPAAKKANPEQQQKTLEIIHQQAELGASAQQAKNAQVASSGLAKMLSTYDAQQKLLLPGAAPVLAIPPDVEAYLSDPRNRAGAQLEGLQGMIRTVQERGYNAVPTPQQDTNFGRILLEMADPTQGWGSKSIDDLHGRVLDQSATPESVTPAQLHLLDEHLATVHGQAAASVLGEIREQVIKEMVRAKVPGTNPDFEKWTDEAAGALPRIIDQANQAAKAAGGKKAGNLPEVIHKSVVDSLVKVNVNDTGIVFRDETSRAIADTAPQYAGKSYEPVIPRVERKAIEGALKRANKPVTDAAVMEKYKIMHGLPR